MSLFLHRSGVLKGAGVVAATATLTDSEAQTPSQTTYTFSSKSFGAADANRYVLVAIAARSGSTRTLDSVTIGGVTADILTERSGQNHASIAIAAVPSGASGDVVVTWSSGMVRCAVAVYRVIGLESTTPEDTIPGQTSLSGNIDAVENGFIVAAGFTSSNSTSASWTGLNEDVFFGSGDWENDGNMSAASQNFTADDTNRSVSVSFNGGSGNKAFSAVSMR